MKVCFDTMENTDALLSTEGHLMYLVFYHVVYVGCFGLVLKQDNNRIVRNEVFSVALKLRLK